MILLSNKEKARIYSKISINKTTKCWIYTGYLSDGYGRIYWNKKRYKAHRFFWMMQVGEIPKEFELDHLCRNRACVNIEHLTPVTHKVNVLRGISIAAINSKKILCKYGHELTPDNRGNRKCKTCNTLYMSSEKRRKYKREYYQKHYKSPSSLRNVE